MAWRAPFKFRICREADRKTGFRTDFRFLMLHDFQRNVLLMELFVGTQHLHGVIRRAEGVHQRQWQFHTQTSACSQHLTDDDVDEAHLTCLMATHWQQGLGAIQAHGRAEATIKFEERGFGKSIDGFIMVDGLVDIMEARHSHQRLNIILTDPCACFLTAPNLVQSFELRNGHIGHPVVPHLCGGMFKCVLSQCLSLSCGRPVLIVPRQYYDKIPMTGAFGGKKGKFLTKMTSQELFYHVSRIVRHDEFEK